MKEECPFKDPPADVRHEIWMNDYLWDAGIPRQCWNCVSTARATGGLVMLEQSYVESEAQENPEEASMVDEEGWYDVGLRSILSNMYPGLRELREEVGTGEEWLWGSLDNITTTIFMCPEE